MKRVFIACAALVSMMMVACTENTTNATSKEAAATTASEEGQTEIKSDIVYVNVDQILALSDIYQSEGVALQQKTEKAQQSWAQKDQAFQADAAKLQDRYQRGLITSANAQAEQEKLQNRATAFQNSVQTEAAKLDEENLVFSNRTRDLIQRAITEVNSERKYKFILSATALVDADTTLNISTQVLDVVNRLYKEDQTEASK
ncbi:MAG: OmpH family outer membrane protein [Rikenellaceae bacterium]